MAAIIFVHCAQPKHGWHPYAVITVTLSVSGAGVFGLRGQQKRAKGVPICVAGSRAGFATRTELELTCQRWRPTPIPLIRPCLSESKGCCWKRRTGWRNQKKLSILENRDSLLPPTLATTTG